MTGSAPGPAGTGTPEFVTIDVLPNPAVSNRRWRRRVRSAFAAPPRGVQWWQLNRAHNGTHAIVPSPRLGSALVVAWQSAEAAAAAWDGPLRGLLDGGGDAFSLDGEVVRVHQGKEGNDWYGWLPRAENATPLSDDEPMVAVVHGIVKRRYLTSMLRDNVHVASRAAFHPGHRGSVAVSAHLPFDQTSISLWKTTKLSRDFAYAAGGHTAALKNMEAKDTHEVGCFLQIRPFAASGRLGLDEPAFPDLPPARR